MQATQSGQWVLDLLDEGDEEEDAVIALINAKPRGLEVTRQHGGSVPGRAPNKKRDPAARHIRLLQQYFGPSTVYNSRDFRNRFRMRQSLFVEIMKGVVEEDDYFEHRPDATGKLGISSLLKVTAALRLLAYSTAADAIDENLELSETTALRCLKRFCEAIISRYGSEYLRPPTPEELRALLEQNASRGFVGMVGSLDCMHWQWKGCPTSLAGQHKGKEKKPTKVLEAVADYNLRIWHFNFGSPGSLNDLNILDQSPLFHDFLQGKAPRVEYSIGGHKYYTPYLLADGIYPEWPVFAKTIVHPRGKKQQLYARRQEACRKDVERCFGVMQARWRIIDTPCRLWGADAMATVMHACAILHNMIVVDELIDPDFVGHNCLFQDAAQPGGLPIFTITRPLSLARQVNVADLIAKSHQLHSKRQHFCLRDDLAGHLWNAYGDEN